MEYVGAEWSSDKITRNPFLSLCSVNFTDCAGAVSVSKSKRTIAGIIFSLVRFISNLKSFSGCGLHPIDTLDQLLMHDCFRFMRPPAVTRQHPLESKA